MGQQFKQLDGALLIFMPMFHRPPQVPQFFPGWLLGKLF
jgi:hypothetical protein